MRQLRRRVHAPVAEGRHGPLPVQRVRPVPQDERHEPAAVQTAAQDGELGNYSRPAGTTARPVRPRPQPDPTRQSLVNHIKKN